MFYRHFPFVEKQWSFLQMFTFRYLLCEILSVLFYRNLYILFNFVFRDHGIINLLACMPLVKLPSEKFEVSSRNRTYIIDEND